MPVHVCFENLLRYVYHNAQIVRFTIYSVLKHNGRPRKRKKKIYAETSIVVLVMVHPSCITTKVLHILCDCIFVDEIGIVFSFAPQKLHMLWLYTELNSKRGNMYIFFDCKNRLKCSSILLLSIAPSK